jgi:hypothetical protein
MNAPSWRLTAVIVAAVCTILVGCASSGPPRTSVSVGVGVYGGYAYRPYYRPYAWRPVGPPVGRPIPVRPVPY